MQGLSTTYRVINDVRGNETKCGVINYPTEIHAPDDTDIRVALTILVNTDTHMR